MKVDQYAELVSEIWPDGYEGNLGNCMAETARLRLLYKILSLSPPVALNYSGFRTDTTYLQSLDPSCPKDWKVSSDQCLPWYIYMSSIEGLNLAPEMKARIKFWGWRTPDGNLVSPIFFSLLINNKFLLNVFVAIQALFFRLPWRWDDGIAGIAATKNSTADYLNWFHAAVYCRPEVLKLVNKDVLYAKIFSYYFIEPNNEGIVKLYKMAIDRTYQQETVFQRISDWFYQRTQSLTKLSPFQRLKDLVSRRNTP